MDNRLQPITTTPTCPHCGNVLTPGGNARINSKGTCTIVPLPGYCSDRQCWKDRENELIEKAIAAGVIIRAVEPTTPTESENSDASPDQDLV